MKVRGITAAAAGFVFVTACGAQDARTVEPDHAPDVSILAASGEGQYNVAESPGELIEERSPDVIVAGAVEGIEQGRDVYNSPDDEDPDPHLVMPVQVSDTLVAGESDLIHDGRVYVEIRQGGTSHDNEPRYPLSEWQEAIPEGSRVMLFLYDFDNADRTGYRTEHDERGLPGGATRLVADPQGLIFEYDGDLVANDDGGGDPNPIEPWDVDSIDEITDAVEQHLADEEAS